MASTDTKSGGPSVDAAFDQYESSNWGGMPEPFVTIHGILFGSQAKALVQARAQLLGGFDRRRIVGGLENRVRAGT